MDGNIHLRAIRSKEAKEVLGKSLRQAQRIIARIRDYLKKKSHQVVTLQEFCEYLGLNIRDVYETIRNMYRNP